MPLTGYKAGRANQERREGGVSFQKCGFGFVGHALVILWTVRTKYGESMLTILLQLSLLVTHFPLWDTFP